MVTRQEVNMQRVCMLNRSSAVSRNVLCEKALFFSFYLMYCSMNSDNYNAKNVCSKTTHSSSSLHSQSISVFEFKTLFLGKQNDTSNNVYFNKWKCYCVVYYWVTCWVTCLRPFNIMKYRIIVKLSQVSKAIIFIKFPFGYDTSFYPNKTSNIALCDHLGM